MAFYERDELGCFGFLSHHGAREVWCHHRKAFALFVFQLVGHAVTVLGHIGWPWRAMNPAISSTSCPYSCPRSRLGLGIILQQADILVDKKDGVHFILHDADGALVQPDII